MKHVIDTDSRAALIHVCVRCDIVPGHHSQHAHGMLRKKEKNKERKYSRQGNVQIATGAGEGVTRDVNMLPRIQEGWEDSSERVHG